MKSILRLRDLTRDDALRWFALLVGLVLFRGRSLFTPLSDPTIGLYLHIGRSWVDGSLPYVAAWDYRPPGFFALYAVGMTLVGGRYANALLSIVSLVAATVAVYCIACRVDPRASRTTGWIAAIFFVMLSPVDDGIAGVAELPITVLISGSIALALTNRRPIRIAMLSGLLAGCALQCKLSAIPLVLVPALLVWRRSTMPWKTLPAFGICMALPWLGFVGLYAFFGQLALLEDSTIGATVRRIGSFSVGDEFARNRIWVTRQLLSLCPPIELASFGLSSRANRSHIATVGWLLAAAASIVVTGEFYERQFFVLVAPACVLGALGLHSLIDRLRWSLTRMQAALSVVLLATFALHDYFETNQTLQFVVHRSILRDVAWRRDQTDDLVATLSAERQPICSLFLIEQSPYVYDLLKLPPPTKFAYSDHLLDPRLSAMAGIDGPRELKRIFSTAPQFIVVSNLRDFRYEQTSVSYIRQQLRSRYKLESKGQRFENYKNVDTTRSQTCGTSAARREP